MRSLQFLPVRDENQLQAVAELAGEIWREHYLPLIGAAQIEYMLARFQSVPAMRQQLAEGYEYFLVCDAQAAALGYLAVQEQPGRRMFISKFYLHHRCRGRGTGRACMEFIEGLARQRALACLWLTVNKANPALHAYQRLGFVIIEPVVADIGGGYVMDDYRMEKSLTENN